MKIENIKEFIVFSRYLNFTAAAKRLYVTQPALSYRIASMEKELGFLLVDRTEPLSLTPTGKAFLGEAQKIVECYDEALLKCAEVESAQGGTIVFERPTGLPAISQAFDLLVSSFARDNRGANVRLTLSDGKSLADVLSSHIADVGMVFDAECFDPSDNATKDIQLLPVSSDADKRLFVLMSADHPLATKDHLFARDLDGASFAMQSDPRFEVGRRGLLSLFARHSTTIAFHDKPERDAIDFLWNLEEDDLVLSDASWIDGQNKNIACVPNRVVRPIEDETMLVTPCLAFAADNSNPLLRKFIAFVDERFGAGQLKP